MSRDDREEFFDALCILVGEDGADGTSGAKMASWLREAADYLEANGWEDAVDYTFGADE